MDSQKIGKITQEGFVTAMHLIKKRMTGAPLPSVPLPQFNNTPPINLLGDLIESGVPALAPQPTGYFL